MEPVTYSQIEELVRELPEEKLPIAYEFLAGLTKGEVDETSPQLRFSKLPLSQRRQILADQAARMREYYEETAGKRQEWQAGEFSRTIQSCV